MQDNHSSNLQALQEKYIVVNTFLQDNRYNLIKEIAHHLCLRYKENRYQKTQWRNQYEVERIIDKNISNILVKVQNDVQMQEYISEILLHLLPARYDKIKRQISNMTACENLFSHYQSFCKKKLEFEEQYAQNLLEREAEFWSLYLEMMDTLENTQQ